MLLSTLTGCAAVPTDSPTVSPTPAPPGYILADVESAWGKGGLPLARIFPDKSELAVGGVALALYMMGGVDDAGVYVYVYDSYENCGHAALEYDTASKDPDKDWNLSLLQSWHRKTVRANLMIIAVAGHTIEYANSFATQVDSCLALLFGDSPTTPTALPSDSPSPTAPTYPTVTTFQTMPSDDIIAAAVDLTRVTILGRTLYLPTENLPSGYQPYTEAEILRLPRYILYWPLMMVKDESIAVRCDTQTGALKAFKHMAAGGMQLSEDGSKFVYRYEYLNATPIPESMYNSEIRVRDLETGEERVVVRNVPMYPIGTLRGDILVYLDAKKQLHRLDLTSGSSRVLLIGVMGGGVEDLHPLVGTTLVLGTIWLFDENKVEKDFGVYLYDTEKDILETARVNTSLKPHLYNMYYLQISPDYTRVLYEMARGPSGSTDWTFSCAILGTDLAHPVSYSIDLTPGPEGTNSIGVDWKDADTLALSYFQSGEESSTHLGDATLSLSTTAPSSDDPFWFRIYSGAQFPATWTDTFVTPAPRLGS